MPEFRAPIDIGNRALQHLGQRQMAVTLGFGEVSKNATEISFAYGKLRQTELRRRAWRFAIKRQVLRPIDLTTMILAPVLFVPTTTYFLGSIVADGNGTFWISKARNNIGNDPLPTSGIATSSYWDPYFGPLTVPLFDPTQSYFAGELVYTAAGDGTYNVYLSRINANQLDPSLPNIWNITATYFQNQVVQAFAAWSSGTTYAAGATVTYTDGNTYTSLVGSNLDNVPPNTLGSSWALTPTLSVAVSTFPSAASTVPYGQVSPVIEWDAGQTYSIGNFVMFKGTEYVSLTNNNTGNYPNASGSTSWAALTGATSYMSLIDLNTGNNPASAPALWSSGTTYSSGQQVGGSDGVIYTSKSNSNLGNNPVTDGGTHWTNTGVLNPWTTVFAQGAGNQQWLQVGGASFGAGGVALTVPNIVYPLGTGPASDLSTANIFHLPANFLRRAPEDPKAGAQSDMGAPTNLIADDWQFEGNFIVSRQSSPALLRFIADVQDVTKMDPMFCEALAADIGFATCETLTQSTEKRVVLQRIRDDAITQAGLQNGIEMGAEQDDMDDWLACRY